MNSKDIDTVTEEDIARWKAMDFSNAKTAEEIPAIKALQEKKGIRKPPAPLQRTVYMKIEEDILAWLKNGGRRYQARLNAILREEMKKDLYAKEGCDD